MAERPELRLIRESMEAVVAPSIASSVLFDALDASGGSLPDGPDGPQAFVDGPLRAALAARLGDDAHATVDDLLALLAAVAPAPAAAPAARRRDQDITREVFRDHMPVVVCVVAAGEAFAQALRSALGPERVAAIAAPSLERLDETLEISVPPVVLVDAGDFAPIEPDALALALERLPPTTVRAIWGADLPFGASVLRALVGRGAPATPFDRREGIAPLLDLIRSRKAG